MVAVRGQLPFHAVVRLVSFGLTRLWGYDGHGFQWLSFQCIYLLDSFPQTEDVKFLRQLLG